MHRIALRALTSDEGIAVERLAHSRTAAACAVERASIVRAAYRREGMGDIAAASRVDQETVPRWMKRFNARGLESLADKSRVGRKPTYLPEEAYWDAHRRPFVWGRRRRHRPDRARGIALAPNPA